MSYTHGSNRKTEPKSRRRLYAVLAVILAVTVTYVVGAYVGDRYYHYRSSRAMNRVHAKAMADVEHLRPGFVLPDRQLDSYDGDPVMLSELVGTRAMLIFIMAGCRASLDEMTWLGETLSDTTSAANILFICAGQSETLTEILYRYDFTSALFYDQERDFSKELGISMYPFHIVVDSNLVIIAVIHNRLQEEDVRALLL
ncbi:MAG: redoxin domain-containing protein [Candidatus Zixiibacteriota bacterium]|nr:MAG: redoxin domain-containing protein [candidate division Zixibacteria bacterium]